MKREQEKSFLLIVYITKVPFVCVNCAATPSELAESELFGYERGSFTGALSSGKLGSFEAANGGTVFLDEVSCLPLSIQAKLLRTLQEREITRIGSTRPKSLDFRVISATNRDLKTMVDEDKFRSDLYYRLGKIIIHIPPLRERKEDIPLYVEHFSKKISQLLGVGLKRFRKEVLQLFLDYEWPGNVRELLNVLENAFVNAWDADEIGVAHLPIHFVKCTAGDRAVLSKNCKESGFRERVKETERNLILDALRRFRGNRKRAAAFLGIARSTFYLKLKQHGLIQFPQSLK
ncbi:MAG: sigma 54-interacting transcriptional regulator [Deltaproteobacteria bacterium]|nr:sigma 54-interacting transcriptional regulator [Deltaproteobacteria bacterium]